MARMKGRKSFGRRKQRNPVDWTVNTESWTPTWNQGDEEYNIPSFIEVETQRVFLLPPELDQWTRFNTLVPSVAEQTMAANAAGLPQPERMIERIKGSLHTIMTASPSSIADDFGTVEYRVVVLDADPYTGDVHFGTGLSPNINREKLSDPVVADQSFMWHHTHVWWNALNWFSEDMTHWPALQAVEVDIRVKRKLEPNQRLCLIIENGTTQRIRVVRRLRVLARTI